MSGIIESLAWGAASKALGYVTGKATQDSTDKTNTNIINDTGNLYANVSQSWNEAWDAKAQVDNLSQVKDSLLKGDIIGAGTSIASMGVRSLFNRQNSLVQGAKKVIWDKGLKLVFGTNTAEKYFGIEKTKEEAFKDDVEQKKKILLSQREEAALENEIKMLKDGGYNPTKVSEIIAGQDWYNTKIKKELQDEIIKQENLKRAQINNQAMHNMSNQIYNSIGKYTGYDPSNIINSTNYFFNSNNEILRQKMINQNILLKNQYNYEPSIEINELPQTNEIIQSGNNLLPNNMEYKENIPISKSNEQNLENSETNIKKNINNKGFYFGIKTIKKSQNRLNLENENIQQINPYKIFKRLPDGTKKKIIRLGKPGTSSSIIHEEIPNINPNLSLYEPKKYIKDPIQNYLKNVYKPGETAMFINKIATQHLNLKSSDPDVYIEKEHIERVLNTNPQEDYNLKKTFYKNCEICKSECD